MFHGKKLINEEEIGKMANEKKTKKISYMQEEKNKNRKIIRQFLF